MSLYRFPAFGSGIRFPLRHLAAGALDAMAQAAPPQTSIYDPPPKLENPPMAPGERLKMQKELNAARDRQAAASKARAHAAPPVQPAKPL
jgi:hypothetical protein